MDNLTEEEYKELFEKEARIGKDYIKKDGITYFISTVELYFGIKEALKKHQIPLNAIFELPKYETMIFNNNTDEVLFQKKYFIKDEAKKEHENIVKNFDILIKNLI